MKISLCLLVKDEERTIENCLAPIYDLFDDIVVMDTGSTDRTCELLRDRFGIAPCYGTLEEQRCFSKLDARNEVIARSRHPWVLFLDADERITRGQAGRVLAMADDSALSGYFFGWDTRIDGVVTEDYKLPLFRRTVRYMGLVHENAQQHLRRQGLAAAWLEGMDIMHYPERGKLDDKRRFYRQRLQCALSQDASWYRYHWFLGYALHRNHEPAEAERYLQIAAGSRAPEFPVECLNSHMALAEIHAARGDAVATRAVLNSGREFLNAVAGDFEVAVNFRLPDWFARAIEAVERGDLAAVKTYSFAH